MKPMTHSLRAALTLLLLGAMTSAHAFVVVADFDGDGLHDEEFDAYPGTTIQIGVYASQTPVEVNTNGGLTGFGLHMFTDGLPITGNNSDAVVIDPTWDFVTQQDIVDPSYVELKVVGNTLTPGGNTGAQVHLFDLSVEIPPTVGELYKVDFSDADNASFVSSEAFVYDDLAVFLQTNVNVVPIPDSDGDGLNDLVDNCTFQANAGQQDGDQDGIGNRCDADLNQDCVVNVEDLGIFKQRFFTSDAVADFDSSGTVNVVDLGILRTLFFGQPGPSGQPNECDDA